MLFLQVGIGTLYSSHTAARPLFDFIWTDETLRAQVFLFSTLCDIPLELPDLAAGATDLIFYSPTFFFFERTFPWVEGYEGMFLLPIVFLLSTCTRFSRKTEMCTFIMSPLLMGAERKNEMQTTSPWHLSCPSSSFPKFTSYICFLFCSSFWWSLCFYLFWY